MVALPTTLDAISNIEDKTLENVVGLTHVYLLIDIEILSKAETDFVRSAQDLAQEYKVQKAASGLPMTSESEVKSADGYMGYVIYGYFDEANYRRWICLFHKAIWQNSEDLSLGVF